MECECCWGKYAFESLVQCSEGHLFCKNCIQKYTEESVFGNGKSKLKCMSSPSDCQDSVEGLRLAVREANLQTIKLYQTYKFGKVITLRNLPTRITQDQIAAALLELNSGLLELN